MRKFCFAAGFVLFLALVSLARAASPAELLSDGHADEAVTALKARIAAAPTDAQAYNLLSRAYLGLERWDDAVKAGEKAVALDPNNSDYHMWLGRAYGEKADHASFITAASLAGKVRGEFERAVALNGANVSARSDLAEFYMEAPGFVGGGKDKALAQAQQLQAQDAAAAFWVKARLAEKDKNYAQAESYFKQAIDVSHGAGEQWLNLAAFYKRQGQLDKMEDAVNHAVAAVQQKTNVLVGAAGLLFQAGRNFNGAIEYLRKYLDSQNKMEDAPAFRAHLLLGNILAKQGDRAGAVREYHAALALASGYQPARDALARLGAQ